MTDDKKVTIDRIDLDTGCVCFQPGEYPPPPENLPALLNRSVCTWLQQNYEFTVRAVLPLVESGNTIAIHVWFD